MRKFKETRKAHVKTILNQIQILYNIRKSQDTHRLLQYKLLVRDGESGEESLNTITSQCQIWKEGEQ